jgi:hypothetical protein
LGVCNVEIVGIVNNWTNKGLNGVIVVYPARVAVMSPLAATDTLDVPLAMLVLSMAEVVAEVILPLASTVIAGIADELP